MDSLRYTDIFRDATLGARFRCLGLWLMFYACPQVSGTRGSEEVASNVSTTIVSIWGF